VSESSFLFGEGSHLVGTLSRPDTPGADTGILLTNAGVISRIGPHRLNVRLARELAAMGYPALRFDLAGLGDSPRSTGTLSYEQQSVADIRAAMNKLTALTGVRRFALIGFCSGADNGLNTALVDERLAGLVMFDPYPYPTLLTDLVRMRERLRQISLLAAATGWLRRRWREWRQPASRATARQGDAAPLTAASARVIPDKAVFATQLQQLVERGCRLYLVYSGSFLYSYNHASQFAMNFRAWPALKAVRCDFMPEVDHVVGECRAQTLLVGRITNWIAEQVPLREGRGAPGTGVEQSG
jgi:pimeloyl-ACP methyl ester carboxylesterase